MKIAGIDPSVMSSGITVMDLDDDTLDVKDIQFYGYTTSKMYAVDEGNVHIERLMSEDEYRDLPMPARQERAYDIIKKALEGVSFVGIEDYAVSKAAGGSSSSMIQIAEFCGGIRLMMYQMNIGYINYGILQIKRYATGDGKAEKVGMCCAFREEFPDLYPADIFAKLKQYESPMADLCDSFWMCEIMRNHMKLEKFGPDSLTDEQFAFLTTTVTRGALALADSPLIKKGCEYERVKKKKKKKKAK